jgi:uncharacterized pyridoxamine 5'-phosphate oxidase family protein
VTKALIANDLMTKLPQNVIVKMNSEETFIFLGSVDINGIPNITPVSFVIVKDEESLLFAIHKEEQGYKNLVKSKKVALSFYQDADSVVSILGRAGVVKAPSDTHPLMNIVRVDVINLKIDQSSYLSVQIGIKPKYKDEKAKRFKNAMMTELKKVASQL